jgi:TonB family protein
VIRTIVACAVALVSACAASAPPSPAPPSPAPAATTFAPSQPSTTDPVAADPAVRDCMAKVTYCRGVATGDPDRTWQAGLARLAVIETETCRAGNGDACVRAWSFAHRDQGLLRLGCDAGSAEACVVLAEELVPSAPDAALQLAVRACDLDWPPGCATAATLLDGALGLPADPERAAALRRRARGAPDAGAAEPVSPSFLEAKRIAGDKNVVPPDIVKIQMVQHQRTKLVASVKLCIDATGVPERLTMLRSSGYRDYDRVVREAMSWWRYTPFLIDGVAAPVCTAVTFVYGQRPRDQS